MNISKTLSSSLQNTINKTVDSQRRLVVELIILNFALKLRGKEEKRVKVSKSAFMLAGKQACRLST